MRHPRQVPHDRLAVDILPEHERDLCLGLAPIVGFQQFAERDFLLLAVGDLDADGVFAGNGRENVDSLRTRGPGDVPLQADDFIHSHPFGRVNLVPGNRGTAGNIPRRDGDSELRQGFDDGLLDSEHFLGIGCGPVCFVQFVQQFHSGQHVIFQANRFVQNEFVLFGCRRRWLANRHGGGVDHLRRGPVRIELRLWLALFLDVWTTVTVLRCRPDPFPGKLFVEFALLLIQAFLFQEGAFALIRAGDPLLPEPFPPKPDVLQRIPNNQDRMDTGHQHQARKIDAREQNERADLSEQPLKHLHPQPIPQFPTGTADTHHVPPMLER